MLEQVDMLQIIESARIPGDRVIPPDRNTLEHVPEKWLHFSDEDMLQDVESARILIDRVIPPDRNTR